MKGDWSLFVTGWRFKTTNEFRFMYQKARVLLEVEDNADAAMIVLRWSWEPRGSSGL